MGKTKTHAVSIILLRITAEDIWLRSWIQGRGDSVYQSPQYKALDGDFNPLKGWMTFRSIPWDERLDKLIELVFDIAENGQLEPIKIYKDMRINTGHKRAAAMAALGHKTIKAEIVPDDYKL